jgi:methylglutaconyl-CoA hydratase
MSTEGYVKLEVANGLATIVFFHPKGNSMPSAQLARLADAIREAGENNQARLILLKSDGEKAFCAGANFEELLAITNEAEGKKFFMGFAHVINAIRTAGKLVICRVQGKCVGGGVGIAAAADYTLATEQAEVKLSELAVGLGPFVVGPAVERKLGLSAFSQLTIDAGNFRSAAWARENNLFANVFPDIATLDAAVDQLVQTLLASNPEAMAELKKIFWEGTGHWDQLLQSRAETSGKLVLSEFSREFLKHRK